MKLVSRRGSQRGNALLEFTFVGIPLMFILISIFEISRGMWVYHTLAHSVREGTRYASVHGIDCGISPNSCSVTVSQIVQRILDNGIGLLPSDLNLTLTALGSSVTCNPASSCASNSTTWPPAGGNAPGLDISIQASYPFRSAISLFWPGAGTGTTFGVFNLPASSQEKIYF